jgi:hypothetical protein
MSRKVAPSNPMIAVLANATPPLQHVSATKSVLPERMACPQTTDGPPPPLGANTEQPETARASSEL